MKLQMIFALSIMLLLRASAQTQNHPERLTCLECTPDRCPNNKKPKDCRYGIVTDICDCCIVCAKGPGAKCGGPWSMYGKCGKDLKCVQPLDDPNARGKCKSA